MAQVLDAEYETVEDAARAALDKAAELYEERAKFTVVGQLFYSPEHGYLDPEDSAASKVSLGAYTTETQALNAAKQLTFSLSTGECFRAWALRVHHGTPHALYAERKEARDERRKAARSRAEQALLDRIAWHREHPDQPSSASEFIAAPDFD